ncbi:Transposon Tf2-6 polyprotein [Labeo rohita]|uniref:Gypsy retrotransposon integrase-like protein 1 n=1 Tax=Labeo rohita TaxID=84645 RepID=A0ABQ8LP36_LABRO|nr:Transposon Tf2-6 polyprotein [Labeo rohita]
MSTDDPFQELVDSLRRVLLRPTAITSPPTVRESSPSPSAPSPTVPSSPMARPAPYSGRAEECNGFLLQCSLIFTMQPMQYPTDQSKIAFIISLLTGPALRWAETIWLQAGPATRSIQTFIAHFIEVFGQLDTAISAGEQLYHLKQGTMSIHEYSLKFRTLAAASGWNERSLLTTYRLGLEPKLRMQLAAHDDHQGLDRFIQHSIRCSDRMSSYLSEDVMLLRPPEQVSPPEPTIEPMILDSGKLSATERQRRLTRGLCLYCGASGHMRLNCPSRPKRSWSQPSSTPGQLATSSREPIAASSSSAPLPRQPRHPWLAKHDPIISWGSGEILKWGKDCSTTCFPDLPQPVKKTFPVYVTSIESPVSNQSVKIPAIYSDFEDVFCPKRASQLPPHRPWDCAIDLVPNASLPKGRIYPLSLPESKAMEEYIREALSQGYIRPSTSPAASSFFFVSKKDGGLRPCIDYRVLNHQTIKFRYPLPLVPAALQQLRSARIFTKLDLRSAYNLIRIREGDERKTAFVTPTGHYEYRVMPYGLVNAPSVFQNFIHEVLREFLHHFVVVYIDDILLYSRSEAEHRHHVAEFLGYVIDRHGVRMDEGKVDAVVSWPKPNTIKELQRFLGFANFYRRFVEGFSLITSSLTNLLKGHPKTLYWTTDANTAFEMLKKAFTQAPLLTHPDPDLPFVVKVDASTTGVGAVLSQHHGTPPRLHPCAYFSRKLSPAEMNYDIGNRELLAIKPALEEWQHWFNFSITYRPGSKNVRADALSRLAEGETNTETPSPIIPDHLIISPIEWTEPPAVATPEPRAPPGCPPGRQFIPPSQRVNLIHTTHISLGTGHPGANYTLSLLSDRFWWPDMARDVRRYVQGCKECAMSKSPRHLPAGKLHPLPVPNRPWSHLGVDFMTDLPVSNENTCILVIVDCFSKFCRLIPLKKLPTALETAEHLFNHVFRYYGIPEDIVSDREPQFISRVWKSFFKLLGVTVGLSSGYHPQTNGQTERKIQEVGRFLRTFCHGHQNSWSQFLGWAEYAQNSLRQPSTGLTSFQCVLGFQPPLFLCNGEPSDVPALDYWFRESERVWDAAHHYLQRAVNRSKAITDRRRIPGPTFTPGQKSLARKRKSPPPLVLEEGSIYSVKEILQSRRRGGRLEYLVDWEGYGPEERSWVPRDDILDPTLILEFHAAHPEYPAPRGRGRPPRRRRSRPS